MRAKKVDLKNNKRRDDSFLIVWKPAKCVKCNAIGIRSCAANRQKRSKSIDGLWFTKKRLSLGND